MTINEMRTKRAKAWDAAKAFLDAHTNSNGMLSSEDDGGEIADCDDAVAKDLICAGYAKEIKPAKPKAGGKANADA